MSRLSGHLKLPFPLGEQPLPTEQPAAAVEDDESSADTASDAVSAAVDAESATAAAEDPTSVVVALPSDSEADIAPSEATSATID